MPCRNEWADAEDRAERASELALLRAALCLILGQTNARDQLWALPQAAFADAGFELIALESWWENHRRADEARRKLEKMAKVAEQAEHQALVNLQAKLRGARHRAEQAARSNDDIGVRAANSDIDTFTLALRALGADHE